MFYAKCANHTIFLNYAYVTLPKIIGNNTMLFMTTLITMEKELKFKKEWFDVLSRCDRNLRTDVVEAVLQYFFTGAEPNFTDDARVIAFGFIRAEIDATRRRRAQRLARKEQRQKNAQTAKPQPAAPQPTVPATAVESATVTDSPPTAQELKQIIKLMLQWNTVVEGTDLKTMDYTLPADSEECRPALKALRRMPFEEIMNAINGVRTDRSKPSFAEFFNRLKP